MVDSTGPSRAQPPAPVHPLSETADPRKVQYRIRAGVERRVEDSSDVPRVEIHDLGAVYGSRVRVTQNSHEVQHVVEEQRDVGDDIENSEQDDGAGRAAVRVFCQTALLKGYRTELPCDQISVPGCEDLAGRYDTTHCYGNYREC